MSPRVLRALLVVGCLAAVGVAASLGEPAALAGADAPLAFLLRGMALIKGAMVLAAVALVAWRCGKPMPASMAVAYLVGASVLAGASMLIWQLTFIPFAAVAFHVAAFVVMVAAWRDGGIAERGLRSWTRSAQAPWSAGSPAIQPLARAPDVPARALRVEVSAAETAGA